MRPATVSPSPRLAAGAALAVLAGLAVPLAAQERPPLPEGPPIDGFVQLLPRGGIPALVDPEFVPAEGAEIPDDAWVLGFAENGEAYAYSLNLLNRHEVVNHAVAGRPIAAVW